MKWHEFVKIGNKIMEGHENDDIRDILVFLGIREKIERVEIEGKVKLRNVRDRGSVK